MNPTLLRHGGAKIRILESAEMLFARDGLESVSIRDITTAAPANVAAVNYHFGNRDGLVAAVVERYMMEIDKERLARLDWIRKEGGGATVETVLRAFAEPLVAHVFQTDQSRNLFRHLADRIAHDIETDPAEAFRPRLGASAVRAFSTALAWQFSSLAGDELEQRMRDVARDLVKILQSIIESRERSGTPVPAWDLMIGQFIRHAEEALRGSAAA